MTTTQVRFPARTTQEFKALMKTDSAQYQFIRSMEDWHQELQREDADKNPVSRLSKSDIDAFTESLIFNNGGLAGARYDTLARTLTFYEFESVLNRFGIHMDLFRTEGPEGGDGFRDSKCMSQSPFPWVLSIGDLCTSNCIFKSPA
ncbi:hypothetical protein [Streptomyces sp. Ag109_G2-15]|uniref:hypothetical protein n=1 Tax=Streptomyces sp. Ag109_G2-15 TaxID=1938850 RepID=UPI000BD18EF5|nr:hypothetical protein [Streptomyces sp. Ag109_G2-15]SOD86949.1 hypothetical protein SAMN06272765_4427 [Streptomyces sp. Ag109_G2-15]